MKSHLESTTSAATRTGKIARLPQAIRQQLNERLADGEPHQHLVAWLNANGHVQDRLSDFFDGRQITEQNLSDWKRGGFLDWQRHQESRGIAREFLSEAEELEEEMGESALLDRVSGSVVVVLLRLFREVAQMESGPEQRQAVLEIARELARLRRGDHQRQRVRMAEEQLRRNRPSPLDLARIESEEGWEALQKSEERFALVRECYRAEYLAGLKSQTLTPERKAWIEQFFDLADETLEGYSDEEKTTEATRRPKRRKRVSRKVKSQAPPAEADAGEGEKEVPVTGAESENSGQRVQGNRA
jgi:hypothetical protein